MGVSSLVSALRMSATQQEVAPLPLPLFYGPVPLLPVVSVLGPAHLHLEECKVRGEMEARAPKIATLLAALPDSLHTVFR